MIVGVPKETFPGERRVALVPSVLAALQKKGFEILFEAGAGEKAGFTDAAFAEKGAKIKNRDEIFAGAEVILQVRTAGANPDSGRADLGRLKAGRAIIGLMEPLPVSDAVKELAATGVSSFSLELIPRITRAQSMDVLSSQATIAGYKAALMAADTLPRMFPMMMTAAGTVTAAKVFVIGAGVAGLQAISTCHRLGAVVQAYDVRAAVKDQVQSVGAKFVELPLQPASAEDKGGYAKAMDEEFYRKQREVMGKVIAGSDVVISTAAVPGKKAPILITAEMVKAMAPGSVVIDLAAERGGNCELTKPGESIFVDGVMIMGPLNLPSAIPYHASQMYAKNISTFLLHLTREGRINLEDTDEIVQQTLVTANGTIVNSRVAESR